MLLEKHLTRNTKKFGDRISATIPFMFNIIPKKATKTRARFKLGVFMGLK
mgnify:CR=1 FL=1